MEHKQYVASLLRRLEFSVNFLANVYVYAVLGFLPTLFTGSRFCCLFVCSYHYQRTQSPFYVFSMPQTFRDSKGRLVTQLPLPDTLVDFWRLVYGNDVTSIVSLGSPNEKQEVAVNYFLME